MLRLGIASLLLVSGFCSYGISASSPASSHNQEVIDVVALGKHGRATTVPSDLHVAINGSQSIVSAADSPSFHSPWQGKLDSPTYSNASWLDESQHGVFVLADLLNTPRESRARLRRQLAGLLEKITAQDRITVYGLTGDLMLLRDASGDPHALLAALAAASGSTEAEPWRTVTAPASLSESNGDFFQQLKAFDQFRQEPPPGDRVSITLKALQEIGLALEGIHGRKSLVWISDEFPCVAAPVLSTAIEDCSNMQAHLQATLRSLQDARIALYPVSADKLKEERDTSGPLLAMERSPRPQSLTIHSDHSTFGHDLAVRSFVMGQLAEMTGGRAMSDKPLLDAVQLAAGDNAASSELPFGLSQSEQTQVYPVNVTSPSSRAKLLYRHMYFGHYAAPEVANSEQLQQEIADGLSRRLLATAIPLLAAKQTNRSGVDLVIDASALTPEKRDAGANELLFDVAVSTLSPSYRILGASTERMSRVLSGEEWNAVQRDGLLLHLAYTPRPHAQYLRVLVRDNRSGRLGAVDIPLACCNVIH